MNSMPVPLKFSARSIVIFSGSRFSKMTRGNEARKVVRGLLDRSRIRCELSSKCRKSQAALMPANDPPTMIIVFDKGLAFLAAARPVQGARLVSPKHPSVLDEVTHKITSKNGLRSVFRPRFLTVRICVTPQLQRRHPVCGFWQVGSSRNPLKQAGSRHHNDSVRRKCNRG